MSRESQDQFGGFIVGMMVGAVIGAGAALLTAPESGRKTRKRLGKTAGRLRNRSGSRWDNLTEEVRGRVDEAIEGARSRLISG